MASIQRISTSAVQLNPEINFSLFQGNFDFSLQKVEVPAELLPLGERLSKKRRQLAEEGALHILARRLGFLFEEILPSVPTLLKAYGTPSSPPQKVAEGIFGLHLGVDSTSIWAGATSGGPSLLMHLLACMLARIWSAQEATAIWAELIESRREVVKNQPTAAIYDTEWSTLEKWDASARAWLQTADASTSKRQQKQVELIVNNLSVAIQTQVSPQGRMTSTAKDKVYKSVLHNFCIALSTLDNLVSGKPQRILDGGVLLGLTCWHLYPDLVILGSKTLQIDQKDALVEKGGVATLSIAYQDDPHDTQDGVYWSLSLANLRYYGTVECKRSSLHDSKLSISHFQALILGASLHSLDNLEAAVKVIRTLWDYNYATYQSTLQNIPGSAQSQYQPQALGVDISSLEEQIRVSIFKEQTGEYTLRDRLNYLHLLFPLVGALEVLQSNIEADRKRALQLVRYGSSSAKRWIGNDGTVSTPFLGPTDVADVLRAVHDPTDKVRLLREISQSVSLESQNWIIRFRKDDNTWGYASISHSTVGGARKRTRAEFEADKTCPDAEGPPDDIEWVFVVPTPAQQPFVLSMGVDDINDSKDFEYLAFADLVDDERTYATAIVWNFVVGIHHEAAIYTRDANSKQQNNLMTQRVPLRVICDFVGRGCMDLGDMMESMKEFFKTQRPKHYYSLQALGRIIDHLKREMPHTTIPMSIIHQSPDSWSWARSLFVDLEHHQTVAASLALSGILTESLYPSPLSREQAFALILQFESGTLSVDVAEMESVMAISSGNSLFVAQRILTDPIPPEGLSSCAVAHAIGNVGRPGIALLFAPDQPDVREHDVEKWNVVNHNPFDGSSAGSTFEGSSLHMSFTGWEGPLRVRGPSAFRGMEAYNLETQISMYDKGEWVADLNILKSLGSYPGLRACGMHDKQCGHNTSISSCGMELVSVDCWEELLSPADRPMILRSGGSWMARLTALSIAYRRGYRCFLLPTNKTFCWTCVVEEARSCDIGEHRVLFVY
ncbi:hypothetical protein BJY04DRAFT_229923 [Aspergillus karnatakaensis]|uniref:uncharacterized protein n=1 Tax=Aspergillus karnatakaensis TaxID=1810916 RepID=UPI003CCD94B5